MHPSMPERPHAYALYIIAAATKRHENATDMPPALIAAIAFTACQNIYHRAVWDAKPAYRLARWRPG